jgi:serine protease inhibitor
MIRTFWLLALATAACNGVADPGRAPDLLTALPRPLSADETRVSQAANDFALRLFRELNARQPDSNVFVSPLSVSFALGMTMNGAAGTTLDEMRATLGFGAAELNEINRGYQGLMALEAGLDPTTTFTIANSVWHRQSFSVKQTFLDAVRAAFDAEVKASPFDESTVRQVNDWVSQKTGGRIPTILDRIRPDDVMFLINAIYFKGTWRYQFDKSRTTNAPFAALGGSQSVPTMRLAENEAMIRLGFVDGVRLGELLYGNGAFVMTIVMPPEGTDIRNFTGTLDAARWTELLAALPQQLSGSQVSLPRFTLEYNRQLNGDLKALGMQVPFSPGGADFSRMTDQSVFIAFVQHKTYVRIDEEGTEAAAVTNVGIRETSLPPCLCVDRPFVFAIRERFSGTILFIGKIVRIPV